MSAATTVGAPGSESRLTCADCGGVKKFLASQAQEHPGVTLEVGCINGGPITQVEQEEMSRILNEAKSDAAKSGVKMITRLATMSYCDLLQKYDN